MDSRLAAGATAVRAACRRPQRSRCCRRGMEGRRCVLLVCSAERDPRRRKCR